ncbi:MAG: hypothetical protein IT363_12545 [Methanoregulaceae archaeon]|nr:hypothetical protein [Methanoregulaceae archaeon]
MLKAGGQLMNLEGLIGADPYTGDIHLEILVPITTLILRNHSAEIEELRFAFFNALTVLEDYEVPEEVYDHIDRELARFMHTCRLDELSDVMFIDLLCDHYRCDRALKLIRDCLLNGRVRTRVGSLVHTLLSGIAVNDCIKAGLPSIIDDLLKDSRPSRQRIGRRLLKPDLLGHHWSQAATQGFRCGMCENRLRSSSGAQHHSPGHALGRRHRRESPEGAT